MRPRHTVLPAALAILASALLAACGGGGPEHPPALREISMSYAFTISPDDSPPHARQDIHYTIQVLDRKTRQPIENGEGQLFAESQDGAKTWDGMAYGPEIGTYHAKLNYIVAGTWAVAIRFHSDSLRPLERIDWMQDVLNDRDTIIP
jgi:hypothetical protein